MDRTEYTIHLEQYLKLLDGFGKITITIVLNLKSPRWKPSKDEGKRRTPYVRQGMYVTVLGQLNRVKRDAQGSIVAFEVDADSVFVGPRAPPPLMPANSNSSRKFFFDHITIIILISDSVDSPLKGKGKQTTPLKFSFSDFASNTSRKRRRVDDSAD